MGSRSTTTAVEIFGSVYYVRGGDNDSDSLRELAGIVDEKMREVASQITTVDTAKVAILAALNLAEELARCTKLQDGEKDEIRDRVEGLSVQLEQVLQR